MLFTLEALQAEHGDSLLLHFGTLAKPQLILIDGGPTGVYTNTLSKRLNALKVARAPQGTLPIRMVMISHIDDDHINGVLQFFRKLEAQSANGSQLPYDIATLWHNSFDDILNNAATEITARLKPANIKAASIGASLPGNLPLERHGALVLASVGQGRELRKLADKLGLTRNEGFSGLVMVPTGQKSKKTTLGGHLSFTVLGPREQRVKDLQVEWDTQIKKLGVAKVAEFVDNSVFNLSSIIVLAQAGSKTMLLTGDARGDDVIEGLDNAGLLKNGNFHVNILKLPHHGSNRNVALEFFQKVTADNYIFSGNGKYGNPEPKTLRMLLEARGTTKYTIYLTNWEKRLEDFFAKDKTQGKKYQVVYRDKTKPSVLVELGDALPN
jgi:hypothetical protein